MNIKVFIKKHLEIQKSIKKKIEITHKLITG